MPIQNVPVDQSAFTKLMVTEVVPRTDQDTGVQLTNKDGDQRKWTVQVVASLPSRWDANRNDSDLLNVTVTCASDPTAAVGQLVVFDDLTVGAMAPEKTESGRIRGGRLFYSATGVRPAVPARSRGGE